MSRVAQVFQKIACAFLIFAVFGLPTPVTNLCSALFSCVNKMRNEIKNRKKYRKKENCNQHLRGSDAAKKAVVQPNVHVVGAYRFMQ
jgi:hypothetical protein